MTTDLQGDAFAEAPSIEHPGTIEHIVRDVGTLSEVRLVVIRDGLDLRRHRLLDGVDANRSGKTYTVVSYNLATWHARGQVQRAVLQPLGCKRGFAFTPLINLRSRNRPRKVGILFECFCIQQIPRALLRLTRRRSKVGKFAYIGDRDSIIHEPH